MLMTPEQAATLRKPFPAQTIGKLPKGSITLDFVGHAAVTDRLLLADPEWSWEPLAVDDLGLPAFQNGCLWIRLTVCGVTRLGVGDGKSAKECIGDAIRNAAMRFGVALDLWSQQELEGVDPNGGDAATAPVRTADDFQAKHGQLERDVLRDPKKATRSKGAPADDPWANVEVALPPAVTDEKWMATWVKSLSEASTEERLRELWTAMVEQHRLRHLTDSDRADLTEMFSGRAKDVSAVQVAS